MAVTYLSLFSNDAFESLKLRETAVTFLELNINKLWPIPGIQTKKKRNKNFELRQGQHYFLGNLPQDLHTERRRK